MFLNSIEKDLEIFLFNGCGGFVCLLVFFSVINIGLQRKGLIKGAQQRPSTVCIANTTAEGCTTVCTSM